MAWVWPGLGWVLLAMTACQLSGVLAGIVGAILIAAVFAAVYHAEVVAHRVGEPFGTLVLAVAVTVIEVALIVSLMLAGGADKAGAGARHGVRGGDDHLQRHRRLVPAGRAAYGTASRRSGSRAPAPRSRCSPR